jgi:hypothetical protein
MSDLGSQVPLDAGALSDPPSTGPSDAERFVRSLSEAWRSPSPAGLMEGVRPLFAPTVRLTQPLMPSTTGLGGFERGFAGLSALVPNLRGRVVHWAVSGEVLYVEFELTGMVGRRHLRLRTCDRIVLREGVAIERHVFMDLMPLLRLLATQPRTWPRAGRSYLRLRRRA